MATQNLTLRKASLLALALSLTALSSCDEFRGFPSDKPPIHLVQDMDFQQKIRAQSEFEFDGWHDERGARRPVHDSFGNTLVVAQGSLKDPKLAHKDANGNFVTKNPLPLSHTFTVRGKQMAAIDRGQEMFDINCSICHGYTGLGSNDPKQGHGLAGRRWPVAIPSFHINPDGDAVANRVPNLKDGELFEKITNGFGTMPAYGARIDVEDRWAIVHYIRALQTLSK